MLHVNNLSKVFSISGKQLHVLDNITFGVKKRETIAIVGPSGSGKTTLLEVLLGLTNKGLTASNRAPAAGDRTSE